MDDNTVKFNEKSISFAKAVGIISGCQTREQLDSARAYVRQYAATYGEGQEYDNLLKLVKAVDERLFPPESKPSEEIG